MQYRVVIEEGPTSFGAYVPDLPGCVAVGETREEVTGLIQEAIQIHLEAIDSSSISKDWRKELESRERLCVPERLPPFLGLRPRQDCATWDAESGACAKETTTWTQPPTPKSSSNI